MRRFTWIDTNKPWRVHINFCAYASQGEEIFHSSCDDPDKMLEFLEYNDECNPYKRCHHDIDT